MMLRGASQNKAQSWRGAEELQVLHCRTCGLPYAKIYGGRLIVLSQHHGEKHVNSIDVEELLALLGT
jgi:hypothetical protein